MTHPTAKPAPPTKEEFNALFALVNDLTLSRESDTKSVEKAWGQLDELAYCSTCQAARINELQDKLKETISAVTKLAKGKSLGALGLPMEESWSKSA